MKIRILVLPTLLGSLLTGVYADDADIACKKINENPLRVQPVFMNGGSSIGCDSLPMSLPNLNKYCQNSIPKHAGVTPNCTVNYFGEAPADIVAQCTATPAYGLPTTVFKYVLCAHSGKNFKYIWAPFFADEKAQTKVMEPILQKEK